MNRDEEELILLEKLCHQLIIRIENNSKVLKNIKKDDLLAEAYKNLTEHLNVE